MSTAKELAAELVRAVQDNDQPTCHKVLSEASRDELYCIAVVLAASVRQDDPLMAHYAPPAVPFDDIVEAACDVADCFPHEFYGDPMKPDAIRARQVAAWVGARAGYTYSELGRRLERNHSTIMSNVEVVTRDRHLHRLALKAIDRIGKDRVHEAAEGARI